MRKSTRKFDTITKALKNAGFVIVDGGHELLADGIGSTSSHAQCFQAIHVSGKVSICLYSYGTHVEAIDGATTIGLRQWPNDLRRASFAVGSLVVVIFGSLDSQVIDLAIDTLRSAI